MFKEGDKVDLIHTVQGVYPNGKYKISNGSSHVLVDEADLVLVKTKRDRALGKAITALFLFWAVVTTILLLNVIYN